MTELLKNLRTSRAKQFYTQIFMPRYDAFQVAFHQTPLVIMLWVPRLPATPWADKRQQLLDRLKQPGHTVFFSEQLGSPTQSQSLRGVEYLQSETADVIVVVQDSYEAIGDVNHFAEYRVVDAKMLLFMDRAAKITRLMAQSLKELKARYSNIEIYSFPQDVTRDALTEQIIAKLYPLQVVKYMAFRNARHWELKFEINVSRAQPLRYNLLELYRGHRAEIDTLINPAAFFILAFIHRTGGMTLRTLSNELGQPREVLQPIITPLEQSELLHQSNGAFFIAPTGTQLLDNLGLAARTRPVELAQPPVKKAARNLTMALASGLSLGLVMIFLLSLLYMSNITQVQLPLVYTPVPPSSTQRRPSVTPTLPITPTPTVRR